MNIKNIYNNVSSNKESEVIEDIISTNNFRIERILSYGQPTSEGEWYDQETDEWVLLIKGEASLLFQKTNIGINLKEGDYLLIKKHEKHRVEYTSKDAVWLCVHFKNKVLPRI